MIEIRVGQVAPSLNFRRVVSRHCRQGADFGGGVAGRVEVVWKRLVGKMKGYQENLILRKIRSNVFFQKVSF